MTSRKGSCGCGDITFSFDTEKVSVINCYCNMCRSHNGAAFTTYVIVPREKLSLTDHSNSLLSYSKENATKHFCGKCGTPIFNAHKHYESIYLIYLGSVKESSELKPNINVWRESSLDWIGEIDDIKSIDQGSG